MFQKPQKPPMTDEQIQTVLTVLEAHGWEYNMLSLKPEAAELSLATGSDKPKHVFMCRHKDLETTFQIVGNDLNGVYTKMLYNIANFLLN